MANNQIKELKEAFDVFDKDGSGNIDANELRSVLNSLGLGNTDDEFNSLMKSMDRNNDGTISFVGKILILIKCVIVTYKYLF